VTEDQPDLSAVKDAVEALVLSFRRYCIWRWNVAPDVEDFRQMLADAEDIHFNGDTDEGLLAALREERPPIDVDDLIRNMPVAVLATDGGRALAYAMRVEAYLRARLAGGSVEDTSSHPVQPND
jgi:hypothetical protein